MKLKHAVYGLTLGMVLSGAFASCSNEMNELNPNNPVNGVKLVKAPDVIAWSGKQYLTSGLDATRNAFGTRASNPNTGEWQNIPAEITEAESAYVGKWFEEHPGLSETGFDISDFYVQHVYTRPGNKQGIWHYFDVNPQPEGTREDRIFEDNGIIDKLQCGTDGSSLEDVNNFNGTTGAKMLMQNSSALKWNYHSNWGNAQEGYFGYFKAAVIDVPGVGKGYYIGFSYYAAKDEQGTKELGIQRIEYADDWVIKITKADGTPVTDPETGTEEDSSCNCGEENGTCTCPEGECACQDCPDKKQPTEGCQCGDENCACGENCECDEDGNCSDCPGCDNGDVVVPDDYGKCKRCGHYEHGTYCPVCQEQKYGDCYDKDYQGGFGEDNTDQTPAEAYKHNNEVEINLSLNDSHSPKYTIEDLISKLSIHVRYPGDVQVTIPVPAQYYCVADDLYIVEDGHMMIIDGAENTVSYDIDGNIVSLTVAFTEGGIIVTTSGINQDVLDYCMETWGDGLNFEVYNYFCTNELVDGKWQRVEGEAGNVERSIILGLLNQSEVSFLDAPGPEYYINAFGWDYVDDTNGQQHLDTQNPDDCTVTPPSDYELKAKGTHLNATPYNDIYTNGTTPDHAHNGGGGATAE